MPCTKQSLVRCDCTRLPSLLHHVTNVPIQMAPLDVQHATVTEPNHTCPQSIAARPHNNRNQLFEPMAPTVRRPPRGRAPHSTGSHEPLWTAYAARRRPCSARISPPSAVHFSRSRHTVCRECAVAASGCHSNRIGTEPRQVAGVILCLLVAFKGSIAQDCEATARIHDCAGADARSRPHHIVAGAPQAAGQRRRARRVAAASSIFIGFPSSATPLYCFCAFSAASFVE